MKRRVMITVLLGLLALPAVSLAQDASPAPAESPAAPAESMAPIGVDTFDVCLAISGPVIQLTPEALTQGISDGTFVIEGLSDQCETGLMAPAESPAAEASTAPADG